MTNPKKQYTSFALIFRWLKARWVRVQNPECWIVVLTDRQIYIPRENRGKTIIIFLLAV